MRWRLDAGFGTLKHRWLLHRLSGAKLLAGRCAKLCVAYGSGIAPRCQGRECGLVTEPLDYGVTTTQVTVRYPLKKVAPIRAITTARSAPLVPWPTGTTDERSWSSLSGDKGGLAGEATLSKPGAQQVLVMLAELAHNLLTWAGGGWGRKNFNRIAPGIRRLVSEVIPIAGIGTLAGPKADQTNSTVAIHGLPYFDRPSQTAWASGIEVSLGEVG